MQALILAAGRGTRLGKDTQNNTKCMLPLNGKTLIERALAGLCPGRASTGASWWWAIKKRT
ncbi:MAG: NTP transferase domain-containing protein [Spirochaetaceae bacterium]|jgi:choline kinase|nr:NTP transferase domain-containing protein [Spirochaetaceae bacterium]